jgi:shikimate dehydrogenase
MKLFGLIGYPLSHSFSEKYFTEKFKREKIAGCQYKLFPLHFISELPVLLSAYPELWGLNVTIPYKEQVIPFMDELDETALEAGAVNTIAIRHRSDTSRVILKGYNTDMFGFRESIRPILRNHHQQALILGTGGAAKAIAAVLRSMNIRYLFVSRQPEAGEVSYAELNAAAVQHYPFIINCTPIGMHAQDGSCPPIPYEHLSEKNFLYDLIYNPEETEFLKRGKAKGALVKNGFDMLRLQADKAWQIWESTA